MRILITNITLATQTGTEIVTRDLALGLTQAGHEVCVFSPSLGAVGDEIAGAGVSVVTRLEDVPFRPDIVHGHHHVETVLALAHFRSVPAIFVCHDRLKWHDSPPRLKAVRRYVAVDLNCLERLVVEAGIPENRTRVIPNAVDLRRFGQRQPLPDKPARALVFSNYASEGVDLETLRRACTEAGLELDVVGHGVAAQTSRPEEILGNYDLVFAKGRCALEALATGCAVILYHAKGLGPMVTSEQVQDLRKWNFGVRCLQEQLTPGAVRRQIARYDPADAARVTAVIRSEASLEAAVADYVRLYQEVLAAPDDTCVLIEDTLESLAHDVGSLESLLRSAGERFWMPPLPAQAAANIALRVPGTVHRMAAGAETQISVEIENRSAEVLASLDPHPVHLSYHWLEAGTNLCHVFDGKRTPLTAQVRPRSRHSQEMRVLAPEEPGHYVLVLTLVQEGQLWFDQIPRPVAIEWQVTVDSGDQGLTDQRTLQEVASWTSAQIVRDGKFANLGFVAYPKDRMLTFVESPQFVAAAVACPQTSCVLTTPELAGLFPERIALAVAGDPRRCFFEIHNRLLAETGFYGADFVSIVHPSARLHPRSWVDEKNVIIEAGVAIGPNACVLGRAVVGAGTVIHAGAVIGSAGFQASYRRADGIELVHAGAAEIGPGCHIFANAVIARGVFRQSTRIGTGCRVGNGAVISHNCVLGDWVDVGHGAVVNGNVTIGANAKIGPGATVVNCIEIGDAAQISLGATVIRNVEAGTRVTGSLAMSHRKMLRLMASAEKGTPR
ncbi:MAG: glycosyltransferase [Bryobacteraceae bacterium]|jgi:UDP-3-O-[3-hydroxymyristoyl] glucosamine N-acyltransferase